MGFNPNWIEFQDWALDKMAIEAGTLGLKGVGLTLIHHRKDAMLWHPSLKVVGSFYRVRRPDEPEDVLGSNYAGTVMQKFAQMMRTGAASGQTPYKSEVIWRGGNVIWVEDNLALFAAYSGGTEDQDLKIANLGIELMIKLIREK